MGPLCVKYWTFFCVLKHGRLTLQLQIPSSADLPTVEVHMVQTGHSSSTSDRYAGAMGVSVQSETFLLQPAVSPLQICLCSLQTHQRFLGNSATE